MSKPVIYLDHAAATAPDALVIAAVADCMRDMPYNASAAYGQAGQARRVHRLCRAQLASMLACDPQEIVFTSGGTESNNWMIRAFAGSHMVVSAIEHHSVLEAAQAFASCVTLVFPDASGCIQPDAVAAAIRPDTKLICLQAANNETGVLQPVSEVYALAKSRRIHLHVDAVAAFGHVPLDSSCCDSLSLSAHKFYGPRGIGALFIRNGVSLPPLLLGGGQERGLRAGTENTPAICGMQKAAELAAADIHDRAQLERALLDAFVSGLKSCGVMQLGEDQDRLPGTAALLLPGLSAEQAIARLDLQGILVSGGAACASHSGKPSHVYTAMGLSDEAAARVIRVSIGRFTTEHELSIAAEAIRRLIPEQAR